jgi:hypothetical protein
VWRVKEELQLATEPSLSQVADWSVLREIKLARSKIPYWLKSHEPYRAGAFTASFAAPVPNIDPKTPRMISRPT